MFRDMKRPACLLAVIVGLAVFASTADAKTPSCTSGGATLLAMSGKTSVVSLPN